MYILRQVRRGGALLLAGVLLACIAYGENGVHSPAAAGAPLKGSITRDAPDTTAWGLGGVRDSEHPASLERVSVSQGTPIHVENRAELIDALSAASGGETILLAGGEYGNLRITDAYAAPVTIAAADAGDPPVITGLTVKGASNVAFEGVTFDYTYTAGAGEWVTLVNVENSDAIRFSNTTFLGDDQAGGADPLLEGYPTGRAINVRGSSDITIENSALSGFWKGIGLSETAGAVIRGNEITQMRVDGIALSHVQDVLIEENHIHEFRRFLGSKSDGDYDHSDMIQMFGRADDPAQVSSGVTISGNYFDIGDAGGRSQTIFMPNKDVDRGRKGMEFAYSDIVIEENVIVNDHPHGIMVGATDGLRVANNTVLRGRSDAPATENDRVGGTGTPQIHVEAQSRDVTIVANAVERINGHEGQADWTVSGNVVVQGSDSAAPGHYEAIFLDADDLTGAPENLTVLPGTEVHAQGAGATRLLYDPTPDTVRALAQGAGSGLDHVFDAGLSAAPTGPAAAAGAIFTWDFGDGTRVEGVRASHSYAAGGHYTVTLRVEMPDGSVDSFTMQRAAAGPDVVAFDPSLGDFVTGRYGEGTPLGLDLPLGDPGQGGQALVLGETATVLAPDALEMLSSASGMTLSLSLRPVPGGGVGEVLKIPGLIMLETTAGGGLRVTVVDGGVNVVHEVAGAGLTEGDWHDVVLHYDGAGGGLEIGVNGAVIGTLALNGPLRAPAQAELRLGGATSEGFEGEIRALDLDAEVDDPLVAPLIDDASAPRLEKTFDFASAALEDTFEDGAAWIDVAGDGRIALEDGAWARLPDLADLGALERFDLHVDFARADPGGRGVLLSHERDLMVELVEDRIKVSVSRDGAIVRDFTDPLPQLDDGALHRLTVSVDARAETLAVRLDGEVVYTLDGAGLEISEAKRFGTLLGDPWKTLDTRLEISAVTLEVPDTPEARASQVAGALEAGTLTIGQDHADQWHSVAFAEAIPEARVVMGPLSFAGSDPATVRVRKVTETGFEFQIDEWDYLDGWHAAETVSWIAGSAGTYTLASGQTVAFGRAQAEDDTPVAVALSGFEAAPAVFAQVTSANGSQAVTDRIDAVGASGFTMRMQEEEANDQRHLRETLDWMAIDYATGGAVEARLAGGVTDAVADLGVEAPADDFVFIADMQTGNGSDTAAIRTTARGPDGVSLFVEEEGSADAETGHVGEAVAHLALAEGSYDLFA